MTTQLAVKHAEYSPSVLGSLVPGRCPGRVRMERGIPELDRGDGEFGTNAHRELERLLLEDDPATMPIEDEELRFLLDRALAFAKSKGFLAGQRWTERVVTVRDPGGAELTRGTVDLCRRAGDIAEAIDWKFHHVPVDRTDLVLQLSGYLLGLMQEWGLEKARGWIYLPRLDLEYTWETTLEEALELVTDTIRGAQAPDSPLGAGAWCRYCRAVTVCPEVRKNGREVLASLGGPQTVYTGSRVKLRQYYRGQFEEWAKSGALERIVELSELFEPLEAAVDAGRAMIRALLEAGEGGPLAALWEVRTRKGRRRARPADVWPLVSGTIDRQQFADSLELRWSRLEHHYVEGLQREAGERGQKLPKQVARALLERAVSDVATQVITTELRRKRT
ncbi:MAG: DUF2800 domain-containing protein [Planctomycetota bacterium]|nr:DUF2800 domain-containing protein [Planctomycetota bacterium]